MLSAEECLEKAIPLDSCCEGVQRSDRFQTMYHGRVNELTRAAARKARELLFADTSNAGITAMVSTGYASLLRFIP